MTRLLKPAVVWATLCGGVSCAFGQTPFPTRPDPYAPAQPRPGGNQPSYNPGYPQVANVPRTSSPPLPRQLDFAAPQNNFVPPPNNFAPQQFNEPAPELHRFEPGKIVAVVGDQYILVGDVQPAVKQMMEPFYEKAKSSAEKQAIDEQRPKLEEQVTRQLVDGKLMFLEFERSVPKDKKKEVESKVKRQFEKDLLEGRDKVAPYLNEPKKLQEVIRKNPSVLRLAVVMETKKLATFGELDLELKSYGSSLDQQIRLYGEQMLGRSMMAKEINFNPTVTHDEMLEFYQKHAADYEFPAKVKWEVLMVRKDNFRNRDEAFRAVSAMGNEVYFGAPLAAVAKRSSQGYGAANGGLQDWTERGSLTSDVLNEAIFSLPEGKLSQILEDPRGLYIIRVLERRDAGRTPFEEAQEEIKEKISDEKKEEQFKKYLEKLRKRTPVWTIYDKGQKLNPNGM